MLPGRSGRSLGERAANSGVGSAATGSGIRVPAQDGAGAPARDGTGASGHDPDGYAAAGDGGEGRHCWVRDPPDCPGTWPGLLVEWRRRGGGWQGRVAYTVTGPHGPALVEAWLPAARLEPR
jgi:hypothetical protein